MTLGRPAPLTLAAAGGRAGDLASDRPQVRVDGGRSGSDEHELWQGGPAPGGSLVRGGGRSWPARPTCCGWYEERARQAEADGVGCQWELDRLIELQGPPTAANWMPWVRRAHLHAREGRLKEAMKDYSCVEAVARTPLRVWYQQCAAEARHGGAKALAQWYRGPREPGRPKD